jgi:hypothetical protein
LEISEAKLKGFSLILLVERMFLPFTFFGITLLLSIFSFLLSSFSYLYELIEDLYVFDLKLPVLCVVFGLWNVNY